MSLLNYTIVDILGTGLFGTAYLIDSVDREGKSIRAVLKIQKCFEFDIQIPNSSRGMKSAIRRELNFYKFVNLLPESKAKYFTKLLTYDFVKNCKHKINRPWTPTQNNNKELYNRLNELDKSDWCVRHIIEAKGMNVSKFMNSSKFKKLSNKGFNNFLKQFAKQMYEATEIMREAKFIHGDIHLENVCVSLKNQQYKFAIIDYGEILNEKLDRVHFKAEGNTRRTISRKYLDDMRNPLYYAVWDMGGVMDIQLKKNKPFPWDSKTAYEDARKLIVREYKSFWENSKKKITEVYPDTKEYVSKFENTKINFQSIVAKESDAGDLQYITLDLFSLYHPKESATVLGWVMPFKPKVAPTIMENMLFATNKKTLLNCFV
jgi:hypothetical protein